MGVKQRSSCFSLKLSTICTVFVLLMAGCSKEQQTSAPAPSPGGLDAVASTTVLATIAANEMAGMVDSTAQNKPAYHVVFNPLGKGVAYSAKISDALHVVHNGKVGRPLRNIDVLTVSPDGRRTAYSADLDGKWRVVIDDKEGVASDQVGAPVFSPDSRHIIYEVAVGDQWHMVVDGVMGGACKGFDGKPIFSSDSQRMVYAEQAGDVGALRLVVTDLALKSLHVEESAGAQLLASPDNTSIAAIKEVNKKQSVVRFRFDRPDVVKEGARYDGVSNLAFSRDGASLSYVAERGGKRFLVLNDKEAPLPAGNIPASPVVRIDGKGVGIIIEREGRSALYEAFFGNGTKEKEYDEAGDLAYSSDGRLHAYAARKGNSWFIVVNGTEGPAFDRVVAPLFSPDGKRLVYRARKDGKRFVVVADASGAVVRQHPGYEMVFPPTFTADGKSVAYGVKDGRQLVWKVEKL